MAMEKRFAAGEHDALDAETSPLREPALHLNRRDLFPSPIAPDVAHEAPAVAAAVGVEDEDGQPGHRIFTRQRQAESRLGCFPPRAWSHNCHRRSSSSR